MSELTPSSGWNLHAGSSAPERRPCIRNEEPGPETFHHMAIPSSLVGTHTHTHEPIEFSLWPMREASQCPHFTEKRLEPQGGECLT